MATLRQGDFDTIALQAGDTLTVACDSGSTAQVTRLGDAAGGPSQGYRDVSPGQIINFGPFSRPASFRVSCSAGTVTTLVAPVDIATFVQRQSAVQLSQPYNRSVAIAGDSRAAQSTALTGTEKSKLNQGFIGWLQYLSGQRINFAIEDNFGVSGDTSAMLYARLAPALAASTAALFIVLVGTNDWGAGFTALGASSGQGAGGTDSLVNVDAIEEMITAQGRNVIFIAELPRGSAAFTANRLTATNLKKHLRLRQHLLSKRGRPGVHVADPYKTTCLANSTLGDAVDVNFKDALHPNAQGARQIATSVLPIINSLFGPVDIVPAQNSDVYDAALQRFGVLNTNPVFDGTAGTINAAGSGVLGTGWSENATPGLTRVYSQPTIGGKTWQQVVLGGTATATSFSVRQVITAGNLAIGDIVRAVGEFEWDADVTNVVAMALQVLDNNLIIAGDFRPTDANARHPALADTGVMRTFDYALASTTVQLQIFFQVVAASTPTGTFRWRNVGLQKVA